KNKQKGTNFRSRAVHDGSAPFVTGCALAAKYTTVAEGGVAAASPGSDHKRQQENGSSTPLEIGRCEFVLGIPFVPENGDQPNRNKDQREYSNRLEDRKRWTYPLG